MSAPASWLLIKSGWKVFAADGTEVGEVDETIGDENSDVFDGISIAFSALAQPRYARADQVASIEQGAVHLGLSHQEAAQLQPYLQPATSLDIKPGDHGGMGEAIAAETRKIESGIVEPTQSHEHPFNLFTRIAHLLRRMRGR
jgi:hypothetical protein